MERPTHAGGYSAGIGNKLDLQTTTVRAELCVKIMKSNNTLHTTTATGFNGKQWSTVAALTTMLPTKILTGSVI